MNNCGVIKQVSVTLNTNPSLRIKLFVRERHLPSKLDDVITLKGVAYPTSVIDASSFQSAHLWKKTQKKLQKNLERPTDVEFKKNTRDKT